MSRRETILAWVVVGVWLLSAATLMGVQTILPDRPNHPEGPYSVKIVDRGLVRYVTPTEAVWRNGALAVMVGDGIVVVLALFGRRARDARRSRNA